MVYLGLVIAIVSPLSQLVVHLLFGCRSLLEKYLFFFLCNDHLHQVVGNTQGDN